MNMVVMGLFGGLAAGLFVVWVMLRPAPDTAQAGEAEDEGGPVIVRQPTRVTGLLVAMNLFVFIAFPLRIFSEPDPVGRLALIMLMIFVWGFGGGTLVAFLRKVSFSKRGIETIGFPSWKMLWKEVETIETSEGMLGNLLFKDTRGRRIAVNATMVGWQELLQRLPSLSRGGARKKVAAALAKLNHPVPG